MLSGRIASRWRIRRARPIDRRVRGRASLVSSIAARRLQRPRGRVLGAVQLPSLEAVVVGQLAANTC